MVSVCFWTAVFFEVFSIWLLIFKEKALSLIIEFKFFSKEKKAEYDIEKISRNLSNRFFCSGLVLIIGIILEWISYQEKIQAVSLVISILVLTLGNFSLSAEKVFEKYKK